jgi:ABC-type Fe3+/spermidine/putrescine transport system ATPase subunit/ABC-type sulfate transport system permease component
VSRRVPGPLALLAGLLAVYLIAPLIAGGHEAQLARFGSVDTSALLRACAVSVASATVASVLLALGGIPLGYVLARVQGRGMAVLGFLVQLPLALPPLASGILLLFLVGYDTPLGRVAENALTDSFAGIVLAETFVAAPFMIIAARSAFASIDPELEEVAATLGRRPLEVFLRVSLPLARPALVSGWLLAWLRAFGEFGATVMVAYHPYSLPVYTYVTFGSEGLPAMLPVLLPTLLIALLVMSASGLFGAHRPHAENRPGILLEAAAPLAVIQTVLVAGANAPAASAGLALNLQKRLGDFHLKISWTPQASRLAILGPSGSGKSLTLKLIAGIERFDDGKLVVGGRNLAHLAPAARSLGYVPQSYGLFPHLDVIGQLRFPVGIDSKALAYWIERLGLRGLERRLPETLSLGQQQRVALARALSRRADLLLLDEPFSALDAPLRASLREELLSLQREFSGTTIVVTHDPTEAALLADELLILESGGVLQVGRTAEVFRRPVSETAARLLGAQNPGRGIAISANRIAVGSGVVLEVAGPALEGGRPVGWSFSPGEGRPSASGEYEGLVCGVLGVGMERHLAIRLGDTVVRISSGRASCARGDSCRFEIDPAAIQVWPIE